MKKLLVITAFICLTSFAKAQWIQAGLNSENVKCMAVSGNNIFAGTENGVFLTSDNGKQWIAVDSGLLNNGHVILSLAISGNNIFAGTDGSGVFASANNGQSWKSKSSGLTSNGLSISALMVIDTNIFAATPDGVFLSTNNGNTWNKKDTGLTGNGFFAFTADESNIFVGGFGGVYISSNNGGNWHRSSLGLPSPYPFVYALAINGSDIYAGTLDGVYMSSNNGANWSSQNNGMPPNKGVSSLIISGNRIFAGFPSSGVYMSADNGINWIPINNGLTNIHVVELVISNDTLFAGTGGGVWKLSLSGAGINGTLNNESNIVVYPNPAKDKLTFESLQKSSIEIYNIQGRRILQQPIQQGKTDIDISSLAKGVYILKHYSNDMTVVTKIVKD